MVLNAVEIGEIFVRNMIHVSTIFLKKEICIKLEFCPGNQVIIENYPELVQYIYIECIGFFILLFTFLSTLQSN